MDNVLQTSAYTYASFSPGKITGKLILRSWLCAYSDSAKLPPECFYQRRCPSAMGESSSSPHTSPVCRQCETFSELSIRAVSGVRGLVMGLNLHVSGV